MKLSQLKAQWPVMSYYQRFESAVAVALTFVIGFIILVALYRLASTVVVGMLSGILDPLDQKVFQNVFGEIMTLLIALEFNHTLQYVVKREQSIIQTKVVLLIALLAIARKFVILDLHEVGPAEMLGLAGIRTEDPAEVGDCWDRALSAGRPAVLEVVTDPEVPPLPPHITLDEARSFASALLHGDPSRGRIIRQSIRQKLPELLPNR